MKKRIASVIILAGLVAATLTGCQSDPKCWFAEDFWGCMVVTDNVNSNKAD